MEMFLLIHMVANVCLLTKINYHNLLFVLFLFSYHNKIKVCWCVRKSRKTNFIPPFLTKGRSLLPPDTLIPRIHKCCCVCVVPCVRSALCLIFRHPQQFMLFGLGSIEPVSGVTSSAPPSHEELDDCEAVDEESPVGHKKRTFVSESWATIKFKRFERGWRRGASASVSPRLRLCASALPSCLSVLCVCCVCVPAVSASWHCFHHVCFCFTHCFWTFETGLDRWDTLSQWQDTAQRMHGSLAIGACVQVTLRVEDEKRVRARTTNRCENNGMTRLQKEDNRNAPERKLRNDMLNAPQHHWENKKQIYICVYTYVLSLLIKVFWTIYLLQVTVASSLEKTQNWGVN